MEKEELLSRVWTGSVVEEANVTQAIFTVRKILGDSPKDHRYIATFARRGYQFVGPVMEVITGTETSPIESREPAGERWKPLLAKRGFQFVAVAITLAVLAGGYALWRSFVTAARFGETSKRQPSKNRP